MESHRTNIHMNLIKLRRGLGITQTYMASKINVSRARYSKWEENTEPPLYMILKLANIHNVTVNELLTELPSITY